MTSMPHSAAKPRGADRQRAFSGRGLDQIRFPLGGIGTGNVSLGGRGELLDWEIWNRPSKSGPQPNTFFALRAQAQGQPAALRVLEAPLLAPHALSHGYHPWSNAGLPRMQGATFRGAYPIANIVFEDPGFPVQVELEAWTPLVPLDPEDSGIPCAVLTWTLRNTGDQAVDLTLAGSIINPIGGLGFDKFGNLVGGGVGNNWNEARDEPALRGLFLTSGQFATDDLRFGNLSLSTDHPNVCTKRAWLRGGHWYDYLREFWDDLAADGLLSDLGYDSPTLAGATDTGSLGLVDTLAPGERKAFRFVLSWYVPNRPHSWRLGPDVPVTRNRYAPRFEDAWGVARYVWSELPRLENATRAFHDALFSSTLPPAVLDAVSANIVPLRSPTCFWLEDGRFFGWEGCFDDAGSCPGSCTHVWSYAQTVAFLFPSLEREMRRIEFVVETEDDGWMCFRTFKTFGEQFVWNWNPGQKPEAAIDGQLGSILRVYREWLIGGDRPWLELVWPGVKRALDYAARQWDTDGDGVPDGKQHTTYDIEFYGPNPLGGMYYLAALRAVEELARVCDDPELAERCRATFERGQTRLDGLLWNGEYYEQRLADVDAHPYQHGAGCLADQLLGQLHAHILGLGAIIPPQRERSALDAIVRHNYRSSFRDHVNCQRTYVLNDEAGLVLCTWPHGGRPRFPFPYSDEVWTGLEYQVAAHLILAGAVEDGLRIVDAVRSRHDGERRNPWNEVECGHHYARSMSSWALLLALSGFHCDMSRGSISFAPRLDAATETDSFSTFWSCGRGWGRYRQRRDPASDGWIPEVEVLGGDMRGVRVTACGRQWTL